MRRGIALSLLLLAVSARALDPAPKGDAPPGPGQQAPAPALSEEQSSALLSIPGGPYAKGEDGRIIDGRSGRPVTPEEAEAALALLRARADPGAVDALLPAMSERPELYFPHLSREEAQAAATRLSSQLKTQQGRLSEAGQRALRLALSGPGASRSPEELGTSGLPAAGSAALLARRAAESPRTQLPASLARKSGAPPSPTGPEAEVPGLTRDINGLFDEFNTRLSECGAPTLGQGWTGNLRHGYRCQTMHDGFRQVIERRGWDEKYPGLQLVGLYQPGMLPNAPLVGGLGNHIFVGVIDRRSGRLTHYFDPWGNKKVTPFTGSGDLPLDRDYLEVRPWDGGGAYRVDDEGRPVR